MRSAILILVCVLAAVSTSPALAQDAEPQAVAGEAVVVGSDTLLIGDRRFQLDGIDAIESNQFCFVHGKPWVCGASAIRALQTVTDTVEVSCTPTLGAGVAGIETARCTAEGLDLAEVMVNDGWALALPDSNYTEAEAASRAAARGVWQGLFVEPWVYRDDIAAIEARYLAQLPDSLRTEAERAMTNAQTWVYVLNGFDIVDAPAEASVTPREARIPDLPLGFLEGSIEEREVFSWQTVANRARAWQDSAIAAIKADAVSLLWTTLQGRPSVEVRVSDSLGYYNELISHAAAWRAAGRQPVLLVRSPMVPSWIRLWFQDEAPPRANVVHKAEITAPAYLGTIDGIDIYIGDVPDDASALLPADLLERVAYRRNADGNVLSVSRDAAAGQLMVDYSISFEWRADDVVWLRYPQVEPEVLNER